MFFLLIGYRKAVFPALYNCTDDLQVVSKHRPLIMKAVLNEEPKQPIGQHLISGVTLNSKRNIYCLFTQYLLYSMHIYTYKNT